MRNRRWAAALVALAVLAAAAGCGGEKEKASEVAAAAHEKKLNLYIWSSYLPQDVLDDFTKQTGIAVHYDLYDSNEPVLEKLQSGVADYDLVVPSDYMVRILIHLNLVEPLIRERLQGLDNLDPRFLNKGFDPANRYSLPYVWGTTGFGYSTDRVKGRVDSWAPLFDPANKGQILMLDDMRECFSAALKFLGESINTRDPAILKRAADLLKKQKPLVKTYNSSDFENILASGDVTYAHGYNGQIAKVIAGNPGRFAYVVPKEGATIWVDSVCIPAHARHTDAIYAFLNFILDPKLNARIINAISYASGNGAALTWIKPGITHDSAIYAPEDALARCEFVEDIGESTELMDEYWTEIKAQ
ncbi:MAG: spermidine/putrescine ABC transporter substrate-binding protein [Acidobacteriota bacterium]